jgi:hypothetical protein
MSSHRRFDTLKKVLHTRWTLRAEDLTNAWTYIRFHRAEIEQQIGENEENTEYSDIPRDLYVFSGAQ